MSVARDNDNPRDESMASHPVCSEDDVARLVRHLHDTLVDGHPPASLPEDFTACEPLKKLRDDLLDIRHSILALANGDLSHKPALRGYLGGVLKMLQSHLSHLTWQTQMVASGDFSQRIDFMGDFSKAFNSMVERLHTTHSELKQKETELTRINEELRREIASRIMVEEALRDSEEGFRLLAIIDPLTGIYNRRHFQELAEREIVRSSRLSHTLCLVMFDIDFFKQVNDRFGHDSGDLVLREVSKVTNAAIRASDIFARYGGEEFVLLLPDTTLGKGKVLADRIRKKLAVDPITLKGCPLTITASFGVARHRAHESSDPPAAVYEQLISRADEALYAAKNSGRNRVCCFPE